ncbi:MAG: threonine synthase [Candidatus Bathyarchaeia archaeon]
MFLETFICFNCGKKYSLSMNKNLIACLNCGDILLAVYNIENIQERLSKEELSKRKFGVWKYHELLPPIKENNIISLGEGGTFLHKCEKLSSKLGLKLYVKNETTNPTGSFLDRGSTVEVSRAVELNANCVYCATSSGNFAASIAAYAARGGLKCNIFIPSERIKELNLGKLYQVIAYGANLIINEHYKNELSNLGYLISPLNPFFAEGEKTTGYELCEQLNWNIPDKIVVPMGHGEHLSMIWMGINEFFAFGLINSINVSMIGVQPAEFAPIVDEFQGKKIKLQTPKTIALDLAMEKPLYAKLALKSIIESKGTAVKVSDDEIFKAMDMLAKMEGIFAEPSAASTIAGVIKLLDEGQIDRSETVVCLITGAGLKDPASARKFVEKIKKINRIIAGVESKRFTRKLGETKLKLLKILSNVSYGYEAWKALKDMGFNLDISSVYQHLAELEAMGLIKRIKKT